MTKGKRGPTAGTEAAKRGGQATRDQYGGAEYYRALGKKGGAAASARIGPEGYRAIGKSGGESTKAKYGGEFYSRIGQLGGSKRKRPKQPDQATPTTPSQMPEQARGAAQEASEERATNCWRQVKAKSFLPQDGARDADPPACGAVSPERIENTGKPSSIVAHAQDRHVPIWLRIRNGVGQRRIVRQRWNELGGPLAAGNQAIHLPAESVLRWGELRGTFELSKQAEAGCLQSRYR